MTTHHKCEILIPFRYGMRKDPHDPGQRLEVEPEVWRTIELAFKTQFGGWTPVGTTGVEGLSGGWIDPETSEEVDDVSLYVVVYVLPERLDDFKSLANAIGKHLEQKEMLIDIAEQPSGEFLRIHDGAMTPKEKCLLFGDNQQADLTEKSSRAASSK